MDVQTSRFLQKELDLDDEKKYFSSIPVKSGCILADNDNGSIIAWEMGKGVIGTPYHSNRDGIVDNYSILTSKDTKKTISLLKKRQVKTIILTRPEFNTGLDFFTLNRSFSQLLLSGEKKFCFIRPISGLPPRLTEKYLFFHVDFSGCDHPKK